MLFVIGNLIKSPLSLYLMKSIKIDNDIYMKTLKKHYEMIVAKDIDSKKPKMQEALIQVIIEEYEKQQTSTTTIATPETIKLEPEATSEPKTPIYF